MFLLLAVPRSEIKDLEPLSENSRPINPRPKPSSSIKERGRSLEDQMEVHNFLLLPCT